MEVLAKPWAKLQKKLEHFLEEDSLSYDEETLIQQNYKLQTANSFLTGISESLPADELDRTAVIFSRLMHVFEFGVLLSGANPPYRAVAVFEFGVIRNLKHESFVSAKLGQLPFAAFVTPKSQAFRTKIRGFFAKIRPEDDIFVIRLTPQAVLVVSSQLARPWLVPHLENVQKSLAEALGR